MLRLLLIAALVLIAPPALAHNTVITRQIANSPGWTATTAYRSDYQAVQDATIAAGSGCANGDIVMLSGGTGTAAKLQIAVSGGSMSVSAVGPAGTYSSVPSNPVTATGGSCSGITLTVTWTSLASRALAGPGWNGSAFTNGSAIYLWVATNNGTSGSDPTVFNSCASPGTTTVNDNGITWKCLSVVDYNTITGFLYDHPAWQSGTGYYHYDYVVGSDSGTLRSYVMVAAETTGPYTCTSGGSNPFNGQHTPGNSISDGTCTWNYFGADLGYSSQASYVPTQQFLSGSANNPTAQMADYYVGSMWSGGAARQEYIPGQNGEMASIQPMSHYDLTSGGGGGEFPVICTCDGTGTTIPTNYRPLWTVTLIGAAGDRFGDNPNIRNVPLRYNSAYGTAVHDVDTSRLNINGMYIGNAFTSKDSNFNISSLMVKADLGDPVLGYFGSGSANNLMFHNMILDGTGWCPTGTSDCQLSGYLAAYVASADNGGSLLNSLVVMRGTFSGSGGWVSSYVSYIANSTLVYLGTASPGPVCMSEGSQWQGTYKVYNTYCGDFSFQSGSDGIPASNPWTPWELTAPLDGSSNPTTVSLNQAFAVYPGYAQIDNEYLAITSGGGSSTLSVTRAAFGSTIASHSIGAIVAPSWDQSKSSRNATSSAFVQPAAYWAGGNHVNVQTNVPAVGSSCGSGNSSSCFSISSSSAFIDSLGDWRLKAGSPLQGAGVTTGTNITIGNTTYANNLDITGTARPQAGKYDLGPWQLTGSAPPLQPGGRTRLR